MSDSPLSFLPPEQAVLTKQQVSRVMGVTTRQVDRWVDQGILLKVNLPEGKNVRILRSSVEVLLQPSNGVG